MNKVILLGNLTRDVELKFSSGLAIGKTAIATSRKTKDSQTGKYDKNEVMFIDLTIFGRTAEIVQQYFRKGSKILVEGRLSFNQWTDQSGMKRSKHSVVVENIEFVESKGSNSSSGNYNNNQNSGNNYGNNNNYSQQQNGGGNSYNTNQNSNYNNPPAPQNIAPSIDNYQQNNKPKEDIVPTIDINDMDDQIPF